MIPIYVGLALLDSVLLWAVIGARGRWALKVAAMIVVLGFNFAVWSALSSYGGWPTTQSIPAKAVFVQGIVNEPDQLTNDPGEIYLWLIPLGSRSGVLGHQAHTDEPRAYRVPYSEALYKAVVAAQQAQRRGGGQPVVLARAPSSAGHGHGHSGSGHGAPGRGGAFHVYRLPTPTPPRKGKS